MSKNSVAVRIAGHDYKILSDGDAGSLRKIASYVDTAMNRVRERTGTIDTVDVSVLTCLNLAREVLALRDRKDETLDEGRLRILIERVETILSGDRLSDENDADDVRVGEAGASQTDSESDSEADRSDLARTLDLPSVEALRDRVNAPQGAREAASGSTEEPLTAPRVAASGRERAS